MAAGDSLEVTVDNQAAVDNLKKQQLNGAMMCLVRRWSKSLK